jgi:hypothetical protein
MIKKNDIVLHTLSGLYFECENRKMERWMNMNPFYVKSVLPAGYLL